MEVCCPKMAELVSYPAHRKGLSAKLPSHSEPMAQKMKDTKEQVPCLIFRSIDRGDNVISGRGEAVSEWIELREYINFCPYCGQDWRLPSVAVALLHLTAPGHTDIEE